MNIAIATVKRVAYETRTDFETGRIPEDLLASLYSGYCTNIDPRLFVSEALTMFPRGNCGLASVYMQHRLQAGEATHGSYAQEGHTVWNIGKLLIADITSDQFGGPKVYVGPLIEPWSLEPPVQR
jgi:hypothetical protein